MASAPERAVAPAPAIPALLASPERIPGEQGVHGEFTTSTDLVKQEIFQREPELARLDFFREHVLLDEQGRAEHQALLADRTVLERTRRALLYPRETETSMASHVERLMRIDHLRAALDWRDNPDRTHLLSVVEDIILEDSFGPMMPLDVKRALAASKLELYELLYTQDAGRAEELVRRARRTRLEKMVEYMAENNQHRLARERELSLRAQAPIPPGP